MQANTSIYNPGDNEYLIRQFTVEDGLPVNNVNHIFQDERGFIYLSTLDGIVRYDGYDFKVFNTSNNPDLRSNRIIDMQKFSNNSFWLISEAGHVTRYDGRKFTNYDESNGLPGHVTRITKSSTGKITVATNNGVAQWNTESDQFEILADEFFQTQTWTLSPSIDGSLIAINDNGLLKWKGEQRSMILEPDRFPIPIRNVMRVTQFNLEEFWIMGSSGIFRYNSEADEINFSLVHEEEGYQIIDITKVDKNQYYFTGSRSYYKFDNTTEEITKLPIDIENTRFRSNLILQGLNDELIILGDKEVFIDDQKVLDAENVNSGFVDNEGSIWVSTTSNGVFQIKKSIFSNLTIDNHPALTNIYGLIQTQDGAIWASSLDSGITRIQGQDIQNWNSNNSNFTNNYGRFVYQDDDVTYAGIWDAGLWKFDEDSWSRITEIDEVAEIRNLTVESMHRDHRNRLFIGTRRPLIIYEDEQYRVFKTDDNESIQSVRVIKETESGLLLMGTIGHGLILLDENETRRYTIDDGLPSGFIRDIFIESDQRFWIVTENLGLARITLSESNELQNITHITTSDGLTSNSLHRIIEDESGYFWISSNDGIMRISHSELNEYADGSRNHLFVDSFDESDGMINQEANGGVQTAGFRSLDGKIWFPNQKGITVTNTQNVRYNDQYKHHAIIQEIVLSDRTIPIHDQDIIKLNATDRNFRIRYTAPNFAYPERMQFDFRIEGLSDQENAHTSNNEARFTFLPPGRHTFRLTTSLKDGQVAESTLVIEIPHYFYETTMFYAIIGIGFIGLIYFGVKKRFEVQKKRAEKLQRLVDEQVIEIKKAADEKNRFFTGITHDIKTPLSLIIGPLDLLTDATDEESRSQNRELITLMQKSSYQLKNLVDQMLDVTKLNADAIQLYMSVVDIEKLSRQIITQVEPLFIQKNIELEIRCDKIESTVSVDKDAWERVLTNLFSNAVKFSKDNSRIIFAIKNVGKQVEISIQDFGSGIPKTEQEKVFEYLYQSETSNVAEGTGIGLFVVRGLIEKMGGKIDVSSTPGKGATFIITMDKEDEISTEIENSSSNLLAEREQISHTEHSKIDSSIRSKKNILVVEDNPDFRTFLHSVLSEYYHLSMAQNGSEALLKLDESKADLIISDIMMPEMNGLDFVRKLRKMDGKAHLPVIFLSAKESNVEIEEGLSTGADIYLTKPIRSTLLLSQIEAVLRREELIQQKTKTSLNESSQTKLIQSVDEIILRQLANPKLTVGSIADALFISRTKLFSEWKKVSDMTINNYIKKVRLQESKVLLSKNRFTIKEAAQAVGFANVNYFSTSFKKEFGETPSSFVN